jgi:hypothetical protein
MSGSKVINRLRLIIGKKKPHHEDVAIQKSIESEFLIF